MQMKNGIEQLLLQQEKRSDITLKLAHSFTKDH
jgi:hypothetical protein